MRLSLLKFACVVASIVAVSPWAAAHESHRIEPIDYLNCEHPPGDAMVAAPAPIDQWAYLVCSGKGQTLVAAPGWQWRYPNSWFDRPIAPAWAPAASIDEPGPKYFTGMTVTALEGDAAAAQHALLASAVPAYGEAFATPPAKIYRVSVENNLGHEMDLWFPQKGPDDLWAILCVPECRPDYAFIIQKLKP
ncbi:MAG: hypothetical protein ABI794_12420 [Betaproteobacteria bacterium]